MSKLLRLPDVIEKIGLPRSTIYRQISVGEFPAPVKLAARAVAWLESDIEKWVLLRIQNKKWVNKKGDRK